MGAIAYLWDKLIPGAGVLLDDCAYSESLRNQKRAAEAKPGGAAQIARRRLVSLADERDRPLLTDRGMLAPCRYHGSSSPSALCS